MTNNSFKIVAIIKNNSQENNSGLVKAFGHVSKKNEELNEFIRTFLYSQDTDTFLTLFGYEKSKYLLISEDKVESKTELLENDNWDILFVCESIGIDQYSHFLDENTLVMFHTKPSISIQDNITEINGIKIKKGKKGQHEPFDNRGYKLLLYITDLWKNGSFIKNKYNEAKQGIIDWFEINDKKEEEHSVAIFKAIYDKKSTEVIGDAFSERDKYILTKKK